LQGKNSKILIYMYRWFFFISNKDDKSTT